MPGETTDALMSGGMMTELPPVALADALRRAGLPAEKRESSLLTGVEYVRIVTESDVDCSLERISLAEYLVHGDADGVEELEAFAHELSAALAAAGVRHRLEVYAEDRSVAAYLHHQWPPSDG